MGRDYWIRKTHRYMGIIVGVQLLLWVASGLYFTWNDIEKVRGAHMANAATVNIDVEHGQLLDISRVLESFRRQKPRIDAIESVELRLLLGQPVYEITYMDGSSTGYQLVNAQTGEMRTRLDEATAVRLARADFSEDVGIKSVELLDSASGHAEFRGRDLPVYRVSLDHSGGTNIYVSARRGIVTARRNSTWRVFDFLWMLHTMDFETRDDFNNTLVKTLSVLGLITVLSGFVLWGMSSSLFVKNRV